MFVLRLTESLNGSPPGGSTVIIPASGLATIRVQNGAAIRCRSSPTSRPVSGPGHVRKMRDLLQAPVGAVVIILSNGRFS